MDPFKRFKFLLETCISENSVKQLKQLWSEKTRFYHNASHLIQILQDIEKNLWFDELQSYEKRALLLAAFFHDAIYDPKKKDNENKSIEFFKASWKGTDQYVFKEVIKLIETTKHRKRPINKLEKIFWDADNSGFKHGYALLIKNENLIRKEFSHVPANKYKEGRVKFLKENISLFNSLVDKDIKKLIEYVEKTYK
jgi:predicted metal-dependent HD superfamily phosphohydrolase